MSNFNNVQLETGPRQKWELEDTEEELKTVAESHVLAFTLQQSRQKWLTSVLPKFSGKTRKGPKPAGDTSSGPPPHNLRLCGNCEVQIGPHIFSDTTFYEAHYLPSASAQLQSTSFPSTSASIEPTMATPAFLDQISAAAAQNPTLASLIQVVSSGKANQDQLQMLSMTLRELNNPFAALQYSQLNSQNSTAPQVIKEYDLVVEFQETPSERFILPRGPTACERVPRGNVFDTVVTSYVRLQSNSSSTPHPYGTSSSEPRTMMTMILRDTPTAIWDVLNRWVGGEEKMTANKSWLLALQQKQSQKTYLGYRLPPGSLLDHLKTATRPYPMKSIKPSIALSKPRRVRKTVQRDIHLETNVVPDPSIGSSSAEPATTATAKSAKRKRNAAESEDLNAAMNLAAAITGANTQYIPRPQTCSPSGPSTPSSGLAPAITSVNASSPAPTFTPALNKQKQRNSTAMPSRPAATEIKCRSCQTPDVPLMLGGRFCRPCVEAGRATADIPQLPNSASRAPTSYKPTYLPSLSMPPPNNSYISFNPTS
ncbi:hypothetical protein BDP27DRAFT_1313799 [Rhodocollybia butyracea]|uniref:Uncharacterized protein n=1 Tax=Rhodocollybia butyracea TaxID=206335 RepID=A0A9P5Q886_9AGAR|nr:hypothetical protein BDP27DRAFT_1313799 [Rhodocollybia butyracea]